MENYKISLQVLSQGLEQSEIGLYAKNTLTLNEYAARCSFQTTFISKLEKWLSKNRFVIQEHSDTIELTVEIFSFRLERIERDNLDVLKDEFDSLKNLSSSIQEEI